MRSKSEVKACEATYNICQLKKWADILFMQLVLGIIAFLICFSYTRYTHAITSLLMYANVSQQTTAALKCKPSIKFQSIK